MTEGAADLIEPLADAEDPADHPELLAPDSRVFDLAVLGLAATLCTGFLSLSLAPAWSPQIAILMFVIPAGLAILAQLVRRGDRAAIALVIALSWTALVSFLHTAPLIRFFGVLGLEASVLIYVGAGCSWALGRALPERSRRLLPIVVVAALAVSATVGLAQVLFDVQGGPLALARGRANGLASYSVYFGALMAGAAVLVAAIEVTPRWRTAQATAVFYFATAGSLSGSRAALAASVLGVVYLAARRRSVLSIVHVLALALGTTAGSFLDASRAGGGDGNSSLQRIGFGSTSPTGGMSWRTSVWDAGLEAWLERPLLGWGLGNFRQASQAFIDSHALSQESPRFDAHNIFVELLVAVGPVGLLLFLGFAVLTAAQARGPLALSAATIASLWLLQPAGLSTLAIALLLAGASMPQPSASKPIRVDNAAVGVGLLIGLAAASLFIVTDIRLKTAVDNADPVALEEIAAWYPWDPHVADLVAQAWTAEWIETQDDHDAAAALSWSKSAIARQPDAPAWLDELANRQSGFSDPEAARETLARALELQPNRLETLQLQLVLAERLGDEDLAEEAQAALCAQSSTWCR